LPDGRSVRPEDVELDPHAMLQATVTDRQYIGGAFEIYCDIEGAPRPWLVRTRQPLELGETVGLRVNASTTSTQKRINHVSYNTYHHVRQHADRRFSASLLRLRSLLVRRPDRN